MMALTQASDHVQASVLLHVSTASQSSMSMLQQETKEQVLGITGENIQSPTVEETVKKVGQMLDPTNEGNASPAPYTEHYASDLSMNCSYTSSPLNFPARTPSLTFKINQYFSGGEDKSSAFEANKMISEDKSHMMEHSMEDIVHAEIFTSLKTGATAGEPELSSNMEERLPEVPSGKRQKRKFEELKSEHLDSSTDSLKSLNDKQKTDVEGTKVDDNGSSALSDVQKHKRLDKYRALGDDLKERYTASQTSDIYLSTRLYGFLIPYKCGICGKTCTDHITLCHHIKTHKTLLYKCDVCEKEFWYSFSLKFHMRLHKTENASSAGYFNTKRARVDSKSSAETSLYECKVCGKRLQRDDEFKVHMQSHKSRTCKICMKEFSNLSFHMRQHLTDKPYSCNICDKSYGFSRALASHVKSHLEHKTSRVRNKKRMETDKSAKKDKPYSSKICDKSFIFSSAFTSHVKTDLEFKISRVRNKKRMETDKSAKNDKPYICKICDKSFRFCGAFTSHVMFHLLPKIIRVNYKKRMETYKSTKNNKPYICKLCDKSFRFSGAFALHFKTHLELKTSRVRNKIWMETEKSAKNDHLSSPQDTSVSCYTYRNYFGRLQCWSCSKSFPNLHQLQNHAVYHSEPNFKCLICDIEFYRKYQLQVHQISHTGFPSHKCKWCNQSFLFSFSLRMHMRIHTSIRLLHRMVKPCYSI
ncbi:hypothetical protein CHS0354_036609 [Potamilus streckersoni]|uniref:C2H2-type domain-containing protein n=1 Tax=Potamilus streckersoni TaxID=2493646 RepID=A0AAE0TGB0_9BIVA|nr:hypothetical protein CHS0354_036609 [Potamilus streckersoni]